MIATECENLKALYLSDETAWLDTMVELIARKELDELDYDNLREYLNDMAIRDRRKVWSRLIILIAHHLKWQFQPDGRKTGWQLTIAEQRRQLAKIFESKALEKHAEVVLAEAYRDAVEDAALETGLPQSSFPANSKLSAREWVQLPVPH